MNAAPCADHDHPASVGRDGSNVHDWLVQYPLPHFAVGTDPSEVIHVPLEPIERSPAGIGERGLIRLPRNLTRRCAPVD
jgi:hypothetical protein